MSSPERPSILNKFAGMESGLRMAIVEKEEDHKANQVRRHNIKTLELFISTLEFCITQLNEKHAADTDSRLGADMSGRLETATKLLNEVIRAQYLEIPTAVREATAKRELEHVAPKITARTTVGYQDGIQATDDTVEAVERLSGSKDDGKVSGGRSRAQLLRDLAACDTKGDRVSYQPRERQTTQDRCNRAKEVEITTLRELLAGKEGDLENMAVSDLSD